eukprot:912158-Prorocentrum_minimum.AAC.2
MLVERLPADWNSFQQILNETEGELEKRKEDFRDKLAKMVEGFVKEVAEKREQFVEAAPYGAEKSVAAALDIIKKERAKAQGARKKEAELKQGMDIFHMHQPPYKELAQTEKELEQLDGIYAIYQEWSDAYAGWKDGLFRDLKVDEMETAAVSQ